MFKKLPTNLNEKSFASTFEDINLSAMVGELLFFLKGVIQIGFLRFSSQNIFYVVGHKGTVSQEWRLVYLHFLIDYIPFFNMVRLWF